MKKAVITAVALTLALCLAVGGTLAYLTAKSGEVKNTFTIGDVGITLNETKGNTFQLIPGTKYEKDPTVAVTADTNVDCYVFVKIKKSAGFDSYVTYKVADGWTLLSDDVYYRVVKTTDSVKSFAVIKDNEVIINSNIVKANPAEGQVVMPEVAPTLTFTAYAVQFDNLSVQDAWALFA